MWWFIGAAILGLASAACIISSVFELAAGKYSLTKPDFWGAAVFHGLTAIAALWMLMKGLGKL